MVIRPKICVTVMEDEIQKMIRSAVEAENLGADLLELRLDCIQYLTPDSIRHLFSSSAHVAIPKIASIMPTTIFGKYSGSDDSRRELLIAAADFADYIDLGSEMAPKILQRCLYEIKDLKAEPIISWHSPKRLDVNSIRTFIQSIQGRAMGKVVMPADNFNDNLIALEACSSLNGIRRLIFCYGDKGRISRVLSPLFGSEWCYASLEPGKEGAPGQLDIMTMRKLQEAFL